jgi:hypothetical protein
MGPQTQPVISTGPPSPHTLTPTPTLNPITFPEHITPAQQSSTTVAISNMPTKSVVSPPASAVVKPNLKVTRSDTTREATDPVVTRSGRQVKPNPKYVTEGSIRFEDSYEAYATNLKKLLQLEGRKESIEKSINKEIDNLMGPGVTDITPFHLIRNEHKKDIINLWLFLKEKRDSNGVFLKDKMSQMRDTFTIGQTYFPTVNPISLFI